MARKSRELRLSQTKALVADYEKVGIGHADRSFRFMTDMIGRLERGKGLSSGQRKYLDNLIDQGPPTLKNEEQVNELLAASEVDGLTNHEISVLRDFAFKAGKGWSLSEKQQKFLESLLAKAAKLKKEGRFRPSPETAKDLSHAVAICKAKNSWYWQHRPGTAKAFTKVEAWIDWTAEQKIIDKLKQVEGSDITIQPGTEPIIDKWSCDKLLGAVQNQLDELKTPKFPPGTMCFVSGRELAIVTDTPLVLGGEIRYPCLVDGQIKNVASSVLRKRQKKS